MPTTLDPSTVVLLPADYDGPRIPLTPAAYLDTVETSGCGPQTLGEFFRHSGWAPTRRKVWQALRAAETPHSRQSAFASCGGWCRLVRSRTDPTQVRLAASCCHDRFCLPCAASRSRVIAANVLPLVQRRQCRFVTLTLRHRVEPLAASIDRLYKSFKALRKHPLWRGTQRGGVAFLEVKRSRDRLTWHPHFHVLTQGAYIDGVRLRQLWHSITTDSHVVDVRLVRDSSQVLSYVTKYASKPFDPSLFDNPDALVEAITALSGRRMAATFGLWRGLQMTEKPTEDVWEDLGALEDHLYAAARGDAQARALVMQACGERGEILIRMATLILPTAPLARPPPPSDTQIYMWDPPTAWERYVQGDVCQ